MGCPWGGLGWDDIGADLLRPTWMGFPCGGMGRHGMGGKTPCLKITKIWQVTLPELLAPALAAKYLGENIKNAALTNPSFTVASHFAKISKSGIAKLLHLHWWQSTLMKISKIRHSQTQHTQWQVTFPELPNLAMSNSSNCTGIKTSC